jgi:hypothetical protein
LVNGKGIKPDQLLFCDHVLQDSSVTLHETAVNQDNFFG